MSSLMISCVIFAAWQSFSGRLPGIEYCLGFPGSNLSTNSICYLNKRVDGKKPSPRRLQIKFSISRKEKIRKHVSVISPTFLSHWNKLFITQQGRYLTFGICYWERWWLWRDTAKQWSGRLAFKKINKKKSKVNRNVLLFGSYSKFEGGPRLAQNFSPSFEMSLEWAKQNMRQGMGNLKWKDTFSSDSTRLKSSSNDLNQKQNLCLDD